MTVRVIKESVIYKKEIHRFGDEFVASARVGNSLIERGYVEKISDEPTFSESTVDEEEFDRLLLSDSADGKEYQMFLRNGQVYFEERKS